MTDPCEALWPLLESPTAILPPHAESHGPLGIRARLCELGLLVPAGEADRVLCPECGDHFEEVLARDGPGGTRFVIECPAWIRVPVSFEARRQWRVDCDRVAAALAAALQLTGKVAELVHRRCWRLGRSALGGEPRDVLLARGMGWNDAATVRGAVAAARKPIVLVPAVPPPADFWTRKVPPLVVLSSAATCGAAGLEIDPLAVLATVRAAEDESDGSALELSPEHLALVVRRQIKAEHRTELTDDAYLRAYRQHGSCRAAAEFLSHQTGTAVSKDAVHRAVRRAGGVAEVLDAEDSDSVLRPVASQARDKNGKPLIRSKPLPER